MRTTSDEQLRDVVRAVRLGLVAERAGIRARIRAIDDELRREAVSVRSLARTNFMGRATPARSRARD